MSDPSPVLPPTSEPLVYRPISGLAVAGMTLASLYTVLVVISTVVALVQGNPFFLGNGVVLVAVAGAVFSFLAQRQIQNSEGTRAGQGLARMGLWLSLVSGLGYSAYANVTAMALKQQAHAFLQDKDADGDAGFFARLRDGSTKEFHTAFLLTLTPQFRRGSEPGNELEMEKRYDLAKEGDLGPLSKFRDHLLVRALQRGGQVEALGVQEVKYEQRSYLVLRNYRITTPEMVLEFLIPVASSEGTEAGDQRKWFVRIPEVMKVSSRYTEKGAALAGARQLSRLALDSWFTRLNQGEVLQDFSDTTNWERVVPREALRQVIRYNITETFLKPNPKRLGEIKILPDDILAPWQEVNGKLQFSHVFLVRTPNLLGNTYIVEGKILVESKRSVDLTKIALDTEWLVPGVEITRVRTATAKELMR